MHVEVKLLKRLFKKENIKAINFEIDNVLALIRLQTKNVKFKHRINWFFRICIIQKLIRSYGKHTLKIIFTTKSSVDFNYFNTFISLAQTKN